MVDMKIQSDTNNDGKVLEEKYAFVETIRHQEALINGIHDTIWSVDTNLHLITANQSFLERVKMGTGKTIKAGDDVLVKEFGKERLDKWRLYYERALKGERFEVKEEIYDPVKQIMHYSLISLSPMFDEKNTLFGIAC